MGKLILVILMATLPVAAENIVFIGSPEFRLQHSGTSKGRIEKVEFAHNEKMEWACVIVKRMGKYYWRSRENKELIVVQAGEYLTFSPGNGSSDYVKVRIPYTPDPKLEQLSRLEFDPSAHYEYTEHLTIGLTSISYWGDIAKFDSRRIPFDPDLILFRKRE